MRAWAFEDGTTALGDASGGWRGGVDGAWSGLRHDDATDGRSWGTGALPRSPRVRLGLAAAGERLRRRSSGGWFDAQAPRRQELLWRPADATGGVGGGTGWPQAEELSDWQEQRRSAAAATGGRAMTGPTGGLLAMAGADGGSDDVGLRPRLRNDAARLQRGRWWPGSGGGQLQRGGRAVATWGCAARTLKEARRRRLDVEARLWLRLRPACARGWL